MLEKLKKLGLYGIGLAILTEEKIEEMVKDAVKEGKITRNESKAAIKELLEASKKERDKLNKNIKKQVIGALDELGVPTKKELSALQARINSLEKEILKELKEKR